MQSRLLIRGAVLLLGAALLLGGCETRVEDSDRSLTEVPRVESGQSAAPATPPAAPELATMGPDEGKNSLEEVTAHLQFEPYSDLVVTRPAEDLSLSAEYYYITGVSDPEQPLLLNGEAVEHRGELGSFGVYAELAEGENTFAFTQGERAATVTITREESEETYSLTDKITRMRPEWDAVARAGEEYALSCIAPSGAKVTAKIGEQTIVLEQRAATAVEAVPATFVATLTPDELEGTKNLGTVVYTLEFNGETTEYPSEGELYVVGKTSKLVVRANVTAATVFAEESADSEFVTTLVGGAVDEVTTIGESMYQLAMGGWIVKDAAVPVTESVETQNKVSQATHIAGEKYDTVVIAGSAPAPYTAEWGVGGYSITLHHTAGLSEVPVKESALLDGIDISADTDSTTLTFRPKEGVEMGGYLVRYDGNNTVITAKPRLRLTEGAYPLLGVTVALDPGHGGNDDGAAGVARGEGPQEREINLEAAMAVRQYLRGLGATVVMTREDDTRVEMDDRLLIVRHPDVDISISLHSNSIDSHLDGTAASGTETYYYDSSSLKLAAAVNDAICEATGRVNRGAKHTNFKMTLSNYSPTVMVEMGFLTNPEEYDSLCSKQGIYNLAQAVGDGVLSALK